MSHAEAEIRRRGAVPDEIEDASAEGERARREIGRLTYEINVQQYACAGLNFGTYYDRSPIIAYDGADASHLYDEQLYALDGAGVPDAASLVRRRRLAVRQDGGGIHAAALRPDA